MSDIDPLLRFREVEVRIMLLEVRLAEQEHLIRTLRARGNASAAAVDEQRMLSKAMDTLKNRRRVLLAELEPSKPPCAPAEPPWRDVE